MGQRRVSSLQVIRFLRVQLGQLFCMNMGQIIGGGGGVGDQCWSVGHSFFELVSEKFCEDNLQ